MFTELIQRYQGEANDPLMPIDLIIVRLPERNIEIPSFPPPAPIHFTPAGVQCRCLRAHGHRVQRPAASEAAARGGSPDNRHTPPPRTPL